MIQKFSNIAAFEPEDFKDARDRVAAEPSFKQIALQLVGNEQRAEQVVQVLASCKNREEMDEKIIMRGLEYLIEHTSAGIELTGTENIHFPALFLTNHRDIILDSAFLSYLLYYKLHKRLYIGIGTNLYVQPWIEDFVRMNKSFSVIRGGNPRELMQHSTLLSEYMHHILVEQGEGIWLAQREGRAKDSNDLTQPAVLKMLTMAGEGDFIERIEKLNITPVALCYEYDPCDYLKAQEFQLKRDIPTYKKTQADDYLNMYTGVTGYKGQIRFVVSPSINGEVFGLREKYPIRNEQVAETAKIIDRHIHSHYHIFNVNRIAYDLLLNDNRFADVYSAEEKTRFEQYINGQMGKIQIENKDEQFLRQKMYEMYANPLINYLKTQE